MQVEKFANHPRYWEAIEQELAVRCFKQKPVSFKMASKHLLQLSDKKRLHSLLKCLKLTGLVN